MAKHAQINHAIIIIIIKLSTSKELSSHNYTKG